MGNMDAGRIRQFVGGSNVKAGGWNAPLPRFVDLRSVTGGIPSSWSVYPLAPQQRFAGSPRPATVPRHTWAGHFLTWWLHRDRAAHFWSRPGRRE